jgi:biopolymer transport protein ExbB
VGRGAGADRRAGAEGGEAMSALRRFLLVALALQLLAAAGAHAAAKNLDELLEQTRTARERERKENSDRERQFQASRDQQAALLAQAEAARKAAEAHSQQLSAQYDANDKEINALDTLLKDRAGNLGELFGVTRQVAGDTATVLSQSLISAQFPEREEFLRKLAASKELPSSPELERLWFEMQREMTESGRVAKFPYKIVEPEGASKEAQVVRVGPFIATSEDRYLSYLPGQRSLAVLSRQPPGKLLSAAGDLAEAKSGYVRAVVDPSRGVLLNLYVERPNVWERIKRGELVGYVIITVGLAGALCAAYQFFFLLQTRTAVKRQLANIQSPTDDNPLGRVLLAFKGDPTRSDEDAEVAELRISEAVLREVPKLERFQAFLRLAVAAGPLLGLVGTVIGMIITFQSITESGSSDPKLMAAGIGQAMIATVLGLGIAIPLLFINAGLGAMSRQTVQILDEQSTGLLAESIERKKRPNVA